MYNSYMSRNSDLTASAARQEFAEALNRVAYGRERIVVRRRGKRIAAVVPIADLELLEELEERIDVGRARTALKEKGSVSWKKLKAELAL